uniref:Zinc finger protein 268 n=4 Tax=Cacopsylla melanoneura TaxID=428564 RepID=A0A8D8Z0R8_9HEMI
MFTTKHSLKYHHTTQHRLNPHQAFVCHVCSKPFHRKSVLIVHLQAHEGVKNFGCDYCPARFSQKISWRVHMMRHRGEFKYECSICCKKYATQAKLNFHSKTHQPAALTCGHCNKKFTTKQYLRQHLNIHQRISGGVTCTDCGAEFKSLKAQLSHKQRSHPIALYDCQQCTRSFTSSARLSKHVGRMHALTRTKYPCPECPKEFLSKPILTQHIHSNHNPEANGKVKPFQCTLCEKKYSFKSKLSTHMKTHAQSPSIACPICGKPFHRKDVMKNHLATHLGRNMAATTAS